MGNDLRKVKTIRPVITKLAWSEEKEVAAIQLSEGTVVACINKVEGHTTFLFSANGYAYRIRKDQIYDRPARAAGNLLREHGGGQ